MIKKYFSIGLIVFALFSMKTAQANELVDMLVSKLGVNNTQASAGVGVILNYLKSQVSTKDFDVVSDGLDGAGDYMKAAEEAGAYKENKVSKFGKTVSSATNTATGLVGSTTSAFSNLGLKTENVTQYLDVMVSYLKEKGSTEAVKILQNLVS